MGDLSRDVPNSEYDRLCARVSDHMGVPVHLFLSKSRSPRYVECRNILVLALACRGYAVAAIARKIGRDHSTICSALVNARKSPEASSIAKHVASGLLPADYNIALAKFSSEQRRLITRYLRSLSGESRLESDSVLAICMIASNPNVQEACKIVLEDYDLGLHYWRIQHHAQRLGYPWVNKAFFPENADLAYRFTPNHN